MSEEFEEVTLTAEVQGVYEDTDFTGAPRRRLAGKVRSVSAVGPKHVASLALRIKALEAASWPAYVYGAAEIRYESGRVDIVRIEQGEEPTLAEQIAGVRDERSTEA